MTAPCLPCVRSKRPCVYRRRVAGTHGGVLNQHTGFFSVPHHNDTTCSPEKSAGDGTGCSPGREHEGEHIRKNERRSWSHGHSHAAERAVSARVWMHSSGGLLGTSEQSPRQREETVDGHYRSGESSYALRWPETPLRQSSRPQGTRL